MYVIKIFIIIACITSVVHIHDIVAYTYVRTLCVIFVHKINMHDT